MTDKQGGNTKTQHRQKMDKRTFRWSRSGSHVLKIALHIRLDGAIRQGVADAEKGVSIGNLLVVEKALVFLADTSLENLARASAAGPCLARVGEVDSGLLGSIENEGVVGAGKARSALNRDRGHGSMGWDGFHSRPVHQSPLSR